MLKNVPEENRAELTLAIIVASSLIGGLFLFGILAILSRLV